MQTPSFIAAELSNLERRYTGPIPSGAEFSCWAPRPSHTVKEIEAAREYCRELCRSRWLSVKDVAKWALQTRGKTGLTAITDREKFRIACRMMKEARILRDAWETAWRDRLCLPWAAE